MDNAFVTNFYILNIQSNEKGYVMRILLFCANSVLKLSAFTHTKQCSSRVREKKASRSTNHCIFLVILAGTALKLENVGPTFPCFALDPSNRPRENKAIIVRIQLQREHILGFSKRK